MIVPYYKREYIKIFFQRCDNRYVLINKEIEIEIVSTAMDLRVTACMGTVLTANGDNYLPT